METPERIPSPTRACSRVKLQCDQRERCHHDLDRKRQLQRPDEAGQDQQIDQAEYELGNQFAPDSIGAAFVHEAQHNLDLNRLESGSLSGGFIGAVGRGLFPLEIHEIQQVAGRPCIAQRAVMRLEFDSVMFAQLS